MIGLPAPSPTVAWVLLVLAGIFEIGWAVGFKYSDGLRILWPSVITIILLVLSIALLSQAARVLPIGTAYAIWTGIGAVGVATVGIMHFNEPRTAVRIACIAVIVAGIVGLKLTTKSA